MDDSNPIILAQEADSESNDAGKEFETATSTDTNKEGVPLELESAVKAARLGGGDLSTPSQG